MRVAIIGARRVRGGTGPFLARFCAEAGGQICAVLGTTLQSAQAAARSLRQDVGHDTEAYEQIHELIAAARPDLLVVASPAGTHRPYLEAALEAGVHVLCEKPLLWGGDDPAGQAQDLAARFQDRGLWLRVQAQWPHTLPPYRALYPQAPDRPRHFEMLTTPPFDGLQMLVEGLPHPLSLLAALAPDPTARLEGLSVERLGGDWRVGFRYCSQAGEIDSLIHVERCAEQPRAAWYALDGLRADRRIRQLNPYLMELVASGRAVPMPDPTRLLVGSLLADLAAGAPATIDLAAVPGVGHLVQIVNAARDSQASS